MGLQNYITDSIKSLNVPLLIPHSSNIFDTNISTVDVSLWNNVSNCPLPPVSIASLNKFLPFYCCFLIWYLLLYFYSAGDILRCFIWSNPPRCPLRALHLFFCTSIIATLCLFCWTTELHLCRAAAPTPSWGFPARLQGTPVPLGPCAVGVVVAAAWPCWVAVPREPLIPSVGTDPVPCQWGWGHAHAPNDMGTAVPLNPEPSKTGGC